MNSFPVGPIFVKGELTEQLLLALKELNEGIQITDRGAYYRVEAVQRCFLTRSCAEKYTNQPISLVLALEATMLSFSGVLQCDEEKVSWSEHG